MGTVVATDIVTEVAFDSSRLSGAHHFNPAMIETDGRVLFAYRASLEWACGLYLCELDRNFQIKLGTDHRLRELIRDVAALEDPRFFTCRGRLYLSFAAVRFGDREARVVQCVGAMDRNAWNLEWACAVDYRDARSWEKNWVYFAGVCKELWATYSVEGACHRVMAIEIDGESVKATMAHESPYEFQWPWGEPRGGTNPVLVDGLYYTFFHSSLDRKGIGLVYHAGCYAFEPEPPFRLAAMSPAPLLAGDVVVETCGAKKAVVFPCGAALMDRVWTISSGYNDTRCKLYRMDHDRLVRSLSWRSTRCAVSVPGVVEDGEHPQPTQASVPLCIGTAISGGSPHVRPGTRGRILRLPTSRHRGAGAGERT